MYRPPQQRLLLEQLEHLRELYRRRAPATRKAAEEQAARERFAEILAGNLQQGDHRPQPHTVYEMARHFGLSIEGAHRFFGLRLERIQSFDFQWNAARTRFIESYPLHHRGIDLPLRLDRYALSRSAWMKDGVLAWQRGVALREVHRQAWYAHDVRYAQVGYEDSLCSPLPAGAIVPVVPITDEERQHPDPNSIYMLQFGNGYRCCPYTVQDDFVALIPHHGAEVFPLEFRMNTEVRIMGRIGGFALQLPLIRHGRRHDLPASRREAPLIVPSAHRSLNALLSAKHLRFHRPKSCREWLVPRIEDELHTRLSGRTLRRYFSKTRSLPRIDRLVGLSLYFGSCYSDVLSVMGYFDGLTTSGYSLEELLSVSDLDDLASLYPKMEAPFPEDLWHLLLNGLGGWSPMFSIWFPELAGQQERILRVQDCDEFHGVSPMLPPGSYLLLHSRAGHLKEDLRSRNAGWERPLYVLRKGRHTFCGHLQREEGRYLLVTHSGRQWEFRPLPTKELGELVRVVGVAVPF